MIKSFGFTMGYNVQELLRCHGRPSSEGTRLTEENTLIDDTSYNFLYGLKFIMQNWSVFRVKSNDHKLYE